MGSKHLALSRLRKIFALGSVLVLIAACAKNSDTTDRKPGPAQAQSPEATKAQINQCLVDACGAPGVRGNAFATIRNTFGDQTPANLWKNEFAPRLRKILEREQSDEIFGRQRVQDLLMSGRSISPENPGYILLAFYTLAKRLNPHGEEFIDQSKWPFFVSVKRDGLEKLLATWPPDDREAGKIIVDQLYLPVYAFAAARARDPISNPLSVRLRLLYPQMNLREAQIKDAKKFIEARASLVQRLGPILGKIVLQASNDPIMDKAAAGEDLGVIEASRYYDLAKSVDMFTKMFDPKYMQALRHVKIDLQTAIDKLKDTGEFKKRYLEAKDRDLNAQMERVTSTCLSYIRMSVALNASGLRRQKIAAMIPEIKSAAVEVAKRYFDAGAGTWLKKYVGNLEFALPDSREDIYNRLRQSFAVAEGESTRAQIFRDNPGPEADEALLLQALLNTTFNVDDKDDIEKDAKYGNARQIVETCEKLPVDPVSDATVTSLGKISISWFSLNHPEYTPAVLAHEIGHTLSRAARLQQEFSGADSNQAFAQSLTCVANRNPSQKTSVERLKKGAHTQWSEEDWADHFSAQVMNELKHEHSSLYYRDNMGCALVKEDLNGYQENTLIGTDDDSHSNGILRVLQIGIDRNDLPASCMELYRSQTQGKQLTCAP